MRKKNIVATALLLGTMKAIKIEMKQRIDSDIQEKIE